MSKIDIVGTIGFEAMAAEVRAGLEGSDNAVELYIDSPGGDVLESNAMSLALAVYALKHPEKQYTCTLGSLCASAAANVLAKLPACFSVRAYSDTLIMYHSCNGLFDGGPQQLRDYAVMMELVNDGVVRALSEKTTIPIDEIKAAFTGGRELWLDAARAKECGLVAEIIGQPAVMAKCTETGAVKQILTLVAQYKQRKLEAQTMDEEEKKIEEIEVKPEEVKPEEIERKEVIEEVEKELEEKPEVDWEAKCGELEQECERLRQELDTLKGLVAKYQPSAKPTQAKPKTDWITLVHALNKEQLNERDYAKAYGKLKAEHKAEFDAFMAAHQVR